MKKKRSKLISMLLTLVMTLSLVPAMGVTASAAETGSGSGTADDPYVVTTYEELQTAMQKAGGGYVRLGANIDTTSMNGGYGVGFSEQIVVNYNVALDLYGHKVTLMKRGDTERSGLIDVRHGSLNIEDSKGGGELNGKNMLTSKRLYLIECYDGAKVTVNSGTLSMWSAQTAQTANAVILSDGTVEINGGTLAISNQKNYDEVDMYLAQQDCAVSMTTRGSAVINGGTFKGRVLLYAHAKSAGKAGSVINGGTFEKSVYVQKDRTKTGDEALDVSIRGGTYCYTPGYYTNNEGKQVSDPQSMFQFATKGFLNEDSPYYDEAPYFHGNDPEDGRLDKYDLTAFKSLFPTSAILVAKGQSYMHRDYRTTTGNKATEVQLVDKLFTGTDDKTELARLMNSEYQTIDVVNAIELEDATLKVGDTIVPDNGGNVTTGDKTITITGKVNKQIAQLVNGGKIDLSFGLNVVKTTKPIKYLDTKAATLSTASNSDGRLNVTVNLPFAQLVKADYSVRLDIFPKKPGTTTTPVGEGLLPSGWKLSADSANHPVTINYNANGGGGTMASQKVMSGKRPYTLPNCTFTAPAAGQVFKGWSTSQNSTDILTDGKLPLTDVESSVTVYAIWGAPAGTEIDTVTIQVKPKADRTNVQNDFRPLNFTPTGSMDFRLSQVYEGLHGTGGDQATEYDATKDYSAIYEFAANGGYSFADGISTANVTINDGQVWQVTRLNEGKNLLVYVDFPATSAAGQVVKTVTIQVKPKAERNALEDFNCQSYTPAGSMGNPGCMIREGLNTDGTGSTPTAYDKTKDYSVIYLFPINPGCTIAEDISADDVNINDGQVYKVDSDNDGRTLLVYVNFPAGQVVKTVTIQVKPEAERTTLNDFACQSYTPDGSMGNPGCMIREGLNTDGTGSTPTAYDKTKDYSVIYLFPINPGCTIAKDISADDVNINDGQVYKVKSDSKGEELYVYVNFPSSSNPNRISNVHLNFKPVGVRHQIADMSPVNWTPGEETLGKYNECYYEGENTDADANKLNGGATYDPSKAYSVSFQLVGTTGVVFADGFDKNSITLSDGKVWKVQRIDKNKVVICVTFPASGDTATKIDAVSLNIKPREQRKALVDFVPTAITPEGMSLTSTNIYKDGKLYTGSYDANTDYYVGYSLNTKSGYAFANGFKKENVTVSNGTVNSVSVINNNYVIVYVDFPATDPTPEPPEPPETETIEKIHLDFKLRSERTTIGDLNPIDQKPGTDKMELADKSFYEGKYTGVNPQEETATYDPSKEYIATFRYNCKSGAAIAKGFTRHNVTLSDGKVQQIVREDSFVLIEVIFPAANTAAEEINELHLTFKPHSDRKAQKDLEPISIAPDNKAYFVQLISVKEGLDNTGSVTSDYDSTKDYFALLHIRAKEGYCFSKEIDEETVTGINGQVIQAFCDKTDSRTLFVYANFPAKAAEDPNYVTEAAVQVAAVAGEKPSTDGITVTSSNADKIKQAYVLWDNTSTPFVAGQEYSTIVYLKPKEGVTFADDMKLKVNGKVVDLAKKDSDGSVQFQVTITAVDSSTPAPTEYAVTVTSGGNGSASANHSTAVAGTEIKLTAKADSGYHFKEWEVVSGGVTVKDNKFNMPEDNVEIKAIFEKDASSGGSGGGGVTKYAVAVSPADNGKVTPDKTSAAKGSVVTITAMANDGYALDTIKATDKAGKEIKLTDKGDGKYTFTMPASKVEVKAAFKQTASKPDKPAEEMKTVVVMQVGSKAMFVNGKAYEKDAAPVIMNDRTLVPIRFVTESLGGTVAWNAETKEVTLVIDGKEIKMTIGKTIEKYGVAPVIIDSRTFVPVRFVADELGATTAWNAETKTVTITKAVTPVKTEK